MLNIQYRFAWLITACAICAILAGMLQFSSVCDLQAVTLDGAPVDDWPDELGLLAGESILRQPVDSLLSGLLADEEVRKVDVAYELPNRISIVTNDFEPTAFVLSENTGKIYGLDKFGRVVPMQAEIEDWERPVVVNGRVTDLFSPCADSRVTLAVAGLRQLKDRNCDLYRLLTELDFSRLDRVTVSVAGLPVTVWLSAGSINEQLSEFANFIERYGPDLDSVAVIDMRYRGQIVCARNEK